LAFFVAFREIIRSYFGAQLVRDRRQSSCRNAKPFVYLTLKRGQDTRVRMVLRFFQ